LFESDPMAFDLIISDQTMPELTGTQLAQEIKSIRNVPFILCTGYTVDQESATKAGIDAFLMKPVRKKELAAVIRQVLQRK
jgi:CheY-like chemotaxis protein